MTHEYNALGEKPEQSSSSNTAAVILFRRLSISIKRVVNLKPRKKPAPPSLGLAVDGGLLAVGRCCGGGDLALAIVLLGEGVDGVGPPEAGGGLEGDLGGVVLVDEHVGEGDPDEELLGLGPGDALHPAVLDEGGDLGGVRDLPADLLEGVGDGLLLAQPHEPRGAVVADLLHLRQRQQAQRHVDLREELHRLLRAQRRPVVHLRPLPVRLYRLRPHRTRTPTLGFDTHNSQMHNAVVGYWESLGCVVCGERWGAGFIGEEIGLVDSVSLRVGEEAGTVGVGELRRGGFIYYYSYVTSLSQLARVRGGLDADWGWGGGGGGYAGAALCASRCVARESRHRTTPRDGLGGGVCRWGLGGAREASDARDGGLIH